MPHSTLNPVGVTTPSDREVCVTRTFDAARTIIWDCHTRPELVRRWLLGPSGWSMPVCDIDLRVGGRYRYLWRHNENGREFSASGEYLEIFAPERLVTSERMEGFEGEAINTLELAERDGRTSLAITMRFASKEARDHALRTGMNEGMGFSFDLLQAIADEIKAA